MVEYSFHKMNGLLVKTKYYGANSLLLSRTRIPWVTVYHHSVKAINFTFNEELHIMCYGDLQMMVQR